jgi:amidase
MVAQTDIQMQARRIARFFFEFDLWLTPTLAEPPVPLGTFDPPPDAPLRSLERDGAFSPFTWIANVTGQPAMSVPMAWNGDGLPIGVHFVGRVGREDTLLRLAAQVEDARPWISKLPPTV